MRRRAVLAGLVAGATVTAGCTTSGSTANTRQEVYNPTGRATIRPLEEPLVQHGLTSKSEQYLYARLFHPGDSLPVTDTQDAAWLSEAVDGLSDGQLALLTNLRTAAAEPAHFWPTDAEWVDGELRIQLERQTISTDSAGDEVVGVALTIFEYDGEPPDGADVVFPSGATLPVGARK